jgi:hypothetical protein
LSVGSCFSVNIAGKLQRLKYNVLQNPCGITFNPASILSCIKRCINRNTLLEDECILSGHLYAHPDFHGSFNNTSLNAFAKNVNSSIESAHGFLSNLDYVIITLGTAFVYQSLDSNMVVNNCHKLPASQFARKMLTIEEIQESLDEIIVSVRRFSKRDVHVILTLSPVRHIKDGMVLNQKSKSRCLLAIHHICEKHRDTAYFPSYEILLDELRDYRFYAEDMIHPSNTAINYIYNQFEQWVLDPQEANRRQEINKIQQSLEHRPLNQNDPAHTDFQKKLLQQITTLEQRYPKLSFSEEKKRLSI